MGASQTEQDNFNGKYVITTPKNTPENWICNQTYFRNHEAIEYTIQNYLQLHNITEAKLSIWIIGSGVIEPLVTCAILEKYRESGYLSDYEIICLDANHLVIEVLSSLIAGETFKVQLDGERIVTSHYTLYFAELAPLFSAPESATNPHWVQSEKDGKARGSAGGRKAKGQDAIAKVRPLMSSPLTTCVQKGLPIFM